MARESSYVKHMYRKHVGIPRRVLEAAKWPEQDVEEEWDLEKWDRRESVAHDQPRFFADEPETEGDDWREKTDLIEVSGNFEWEVVRGESLSHPVAQRKTHHNAAKLAGGIVAGVLLIGGGIYANQIASSPPRGPAVPVKMPWKKTVETAAYGAKESAPALQLVLPKRFNPFKPLPVGGLSASPEKASSSPRRAAQVRHRRIRKLSYNDDDSINAPMTLTPETAPPPQRALPAVPR